MYIKPRIKLMCEDGFKYWDCNGYLGFSPEGAYHSWYISKYSDWEI